MTTEILGSITYAETPTVNGTAVLLNGSNPTSANITFGNVDASGTLTAVNLSGTNTGDQVIPTTLPASDVFAWAKAATKPTYTYTEVGAQVAGSYSAAVHAHATTDITGFAAAALAAAPAETTVTIKTALGITTLSGSNTGDQTITLTGDVTGSGTGSFAATLSNIGTAGTYTTVTTDATGRVTGGSATQSWSTITATPTTLAGYGITDGGGGTASVLQTLVTAVPAASGTSTITLNNSTPTITSGTQLWSQVITPSLVSSKVALRGTFIVSHATAARTVVAMVFRGSTCISVVAQYCGTTANTINTLPISIVDSPAATTAQTYSIRIAGSGTGTWYVGQTGTPYFAGLLATSDILTQELA